MKNIKKLKILMVSFLCVVALASCGSNQTSSESKNTEKSSQQSTQEKLPDAVAFELKDIDGNTHTMSQYKGKKVLIEFWASWCHICTDNLPKMNELFKKKDRGYEILTVVSPSSPNNEKSVEDFKKWFKNQGYDDMVVLLDEGGSLLESYGVRAFPTNVIVNADGKVTHFAPGALREEQIDTIMKEI